MVGFDFFFFLPVYLIQRTYEDYDKNSDQSALLSALKVHVGGRLGGVGTHATLLQAKHAC